MATTNSVKSDWITEAATARGFNNPDDALALDLDAIDSTEDAAKAVEALATSKPYLTRRGAPVVVPEDINDPRYRHELGSDILAILRAAKG